MQIDGHLAVAALVALATTVAGAGAGRAGGGTGGSAAPVSESPPPPPAPPPPTLSTVLVPSVLMKLSGAPPSARRCRRCPPTPTAHRQEMTAEEKAERRMRRNRASAATSRERKRKYIEELENAVSSLEEQVVALYEENRLWQSLELPPLDDGTLTPCVTPICSGFVSHKLSTPTRATAPAPASSPAAQSTRRANRLVERYAVKSHSYAARMGDGRGSARRPRRVRREVGHRVEAARALPRAHGRQLSASTSAWSACLKA